MSRKQACQHASWCAVASRQREKHRKVDGGWWQGRSVTSLSGFWGVAHPALMTTQKLLGCRHHEMDLNPESVVYTRERGWRDFRKQDERGGTHRPQEMSCVRRKYSVRKRGDVEGQEVRDRQTPGPVLRSPSVAGPSPELAASERCGSHAGARTHTRACWEI